MRSHGRGLKFASQRLGALFLSWVGSSFPEETTIVHAGRALLFCLTLTHTLTLVGRPRGRRQAQQQRRDETRRDGHSLRASSIAPALAAQDEPAATRGPRTRTHPTRPRSKRVPDSVRQTAPPPTGVAATTAPSSPPLPSASARPATPSTTPLRSAPADIVPRSHPSTTDTTSLAFPSRPPI